MGPDLAKVGLKFRCMEVYKCAMRGGMVARTHTAGVFKIYVCDCDD